MSNLRRYALIAVSVAAALLAYRLAGRLDTGEEAGGRLTGPMILACFASIPLLAASIALHSRYRRLGITLWIGGMMLAVPLASWRLAPGWWSVISPWPEKGERAPFYLDWYCVALIACLFISLFMQTWTPRK